MYCRGVSIGYLRRELCVWSLKRHINQAAVADGRDAQRFEVTCR